MLNCLRATSVFGLFAVAGLAPVFGSAIYIIQKDTRFTQTSTSAPATPDSFDFFATVSPNPSDTFDGGNVVGPAAFGTQALTNNGGGNLQFASGLIATQFPTGTYTFNVTDSGTPANNTSVPVNDTTENFPSAIPALSGASFTALQSYDPTQAMTVTFNTFTSPDSPLAFFAILNLNTFATPVFDGLQPNAGQDTIPANALAPGTPYEFILFFTDNLVTGNGPVVTQLQLTDRTRGFFTTESAVPEPSTALLGIIGLGAIYGLRRRRSARRVTSTTR